MNPKFRKWLMALAVAGGAVMFMGTGGQTIDGKAARDLVKKGAVLLDVRTPEEFRGGHLDGALNIPVQELDKRLGELAGRKDTDVVVYCRSGRRSADAKRLMEAQGFKKVHDLGPMTAW